jgi:hypothetical protein
MAAGAGAVTITFMRTVPPCRSLLVLLAAAGPAAAGAARAETPSTPALARPPHACALLSRDEFQRIAGEPVAEPRQGPPLPPPKADVFVSECTYLSADGAHSVTLLVRTSQKGDNDPDYVRRAFTRGGMLVQEMRGLGDSAFWAGRQLNAFKGAHVQVVVTVAGFADARGFARARQRGEKVARRALERL